MQFFREGNLLQRPWPVYWEMHLHIRNLCLLEYIHIYILHIYIYVCIYIYRYYLCIYYIIPGSLASSISMRQKLFQTQNKASHTSSSTNAKSIFSNFPMDYIFAEK